MIEVQDSPKRPIEDIILDWLIDCGQAKMAKSGSTYYKIEYKGLFQSFEVLLDKLIENGYSEEYIKSVGLNTKIAKSIWPDHVAGIPLSRLNENRKLYMSFWYSYPGKSDSVKVTVVGKRFRGKVDKPEVIKEVANEKKIDLSPDWEPKDRLKMDASDIIEAEDDLDFLQELKDAVGDICE